jgi:uncharacterized protein (DUF1330 family)
MSLPLVRRTTFACCHETGSNREEAMRMRYAFLALGSFVLGAAAVQSLHAAASPPAYLVAETTVTDPDSYKNEYLPAIQKTIAEAGGKYIAGGNNKTVTLIGASPPTRVVIIQYESVDKAKSWFDSAPVKEARKLGEKSMSVRSYVVEGIAP